MSDFHFLRPEWFLVLPPLLALIFWRAWRPEVVRNWQAVCDRQLLPHLLLGRSGRRRRPFWLLALWALLMVLALAGPTWQQKEQPVFREQAALVILLDLSSSMLATDLPPSRYLRARFKLEDLLQQRPQGQTALIAFAADAFVVSPLTEDRQTIGALLKSLEPDLMPAQGSRPDRAIRRGLDLLRRAEVKTGRLLLVTDEDRPERFLSAARAVADEGFGLAVLGIDRPRKAAVAHEDAAGSAQVRSDVDAPLLNQVGLARLASAGGGAYADLALTDQDLQALLAGLEDRRLERARQVAQGGSFRWQEAGIWLLWPLCLLAACGFRRGWLFVAAVLLLMPTSARAMSWTDLWRTPDQQAARAFSQQQYRLAAEMFQDVRWKSAALYRAGDFSAAAKLLRHPQSISDWYNLGTVRARMGDFPAALRAYQQVLSLAPGHEDALFNKRLVERALKRRDSGKQRGEGSRTDEMTRHGNREKLPSAVQRFPSASQNRQQGQPAGQGRSDADLDRSSAAVDHATSSTTAAQSRGASSPVAGAGRAQASAEQSDQANRPAGSRGDSGAESSQTLDERQARRLLEQIADDPGGLLRRKFLYLTEQRAQRNKAEQP